MKYFLYIVLILFFIGCSSKEYFEPNSDNVKFLSYNITKQTKLHSHIKTFNKTGATLEDGTIITKDGMEIYKLPAGFNFINKVNNIIIGANAKNQIVIQNKIYTLNKIVVSASLKDNLLALIFTDNSIALYDISKEKIIYKDYFSEALANDIRITNPIFMKEIVLFPTLDGKVAVVSLKNLNTLKVITVDTSAKFKNITFFQIVNDILIAATANEIVTIGGANSNIKKLEIRDIIAVDKYIYVVTLDGQVLKLDNNLMVLAKTKYKYAKFSNIGYHNNHLYLMESQSYLIELDMNLKNETIYLFDFYNKAKSVMLGGKIYFSKLHLADDSSFYIKDYYINLP
jgi:hypothetical protein